MRPRLTSYITLQPCPNIPPCGRHDCCTRAASPAESGPETEIEVIVIGQIFGSGGGIDGCGRALMAFCVITPIPTLAANRRF